MIRPAAALHVKRWAEIALAAAFAALGVYFITRGGYVLPALGAVLAIAALPMAIAAYRRLKFTQNISGEGLIEVVEGELRFFAPQSEQGQDATLGGFINLPDLAELRLVHIDHRRFWRMKTTDGQALIVPVDAAGHPALFDVFANLPRIDSAALLDALTNPPVTGSAVQTLWRREGT
jgi:hypothetical protein